MYPCSQSFQPSTPVASGSVLRIRCINVYELPILACTHGSQTMYIVLDCGAQSSLMSLKVARKLNLNVEKRPLQTK